MAHKLRGVRMSDEFFDRVKSCAKVEGQTYSEFVRRALLRECELVEKRTAPSSGEAESREGPISPPSAGATPAPATNR